MPRYTDLELARLRSVIENCRTLTSGDIREVGRAVEDGKCPPHLIPFWSLMSPGNQDDFDAQLVRKLEADPVVSDYSCYAFFPQIYPRLYQLGERPQVRFDGRTRGRVALLRFAEGAGLVVKPLQSRREAEIALLAGEAGIGPRQVPSLEGFLAEELVEGRFFTDFAPDDLNDDLVYQVGHRLGSMLSTLHQSRICYNDATLSDPEGRSHLLVQLPNAHQAAPSPGFRLIDFGVSVLLDRFPDLEMEEVFNLARTMPEYRIVSRLGLRGSDLGHFLAQYRQRLSTSGIEQILACDLRFTEEGLRQAAVTLGTRIIDPFQQGFTQAYDR